MWTKITRPKYERAGQRYSSDLTDAEWVVIEPHMPATKRLVRLRLETSAARVRVPIGGSRSFRDTACGSVRNRIAAIGRC